MSLYKLKVKETLVAAQQWFVKDATIEDPVSLETAPSPGADGEVIRFGLLHTHADGVLKVNDGDYIINHAADEDGIKKWSVMPRLEFEDKYEAAHEARIGELTKGYDKGMLGDGRPKDDHLKAGSFDPGHPVSPPPHLPTPPHDPDGKPSKAGK